MNTLIAVIGTPVLAIIYIHGFIFLSIKILTPGDYITSGEREYLQQEYSKKQEQIKLDSTLNETNVSVQDTSNICDIPIDIKIPNIFEEVTRKKIPGIFEVVSPRKDSY